MFFLQVKVTCEDGHKHCDYWAKNDECKKNPEWWISFQLKFFSSHNLTWPLKNRHERNDAEIRANVYTDFCMLGCWLAVLYLAINARTNVMTTTSIARYGSQSILIRLRCFCLDLTSIFRIGQSWANARRTQTTWTSTAPRCRSLYLIIYIH